ncbi:HAMP domain-containing sensor histidine kinase [Myxococcaceae bacterium GXIMD 01537]
MLRRLLSTLVALALGLAGLGWGLWSLQRIFAAEREDARASLLARRQALEQYALATLRQWLKEQLEMATPAIDAAAKDPLELARGLYLRERGEQKLPRLALMAPGDATPAKDCYLRLREGTEVATEAEGPWAERLRRVYALRAALARGDTASAHRALDAFLQHRVQYLLVAPKDLPSVLLVLESMAEHEAAPSRLVQALVRGGVGEGGRLWKGLQRTLLVRRSRVSRADFDFLRERVSALATRVRVPSVDFEARVKDLVGTPLAMPEALPGLVLLRSGWLLEPVGSDTVRGMAVELPVLMEALTREMRERGLMGADGEVRLPREGEVLPLASLRLTVETSRWAAEEAALEQRFRLKTAMVGVCAVLAVGIAVLAFVSQQRKYRFLELKSDFVATVSHELRTPLASIRLLAETLERRVAGVPEARDYPARIIREADGLGFLVENLLSFNRIDKGRWAARPAPVRLEELVGTLRRDLQGWTQVPVELTSDTRDLELHADPQLLRLLFANLARNAIHYNTRDPVRLHVEALPGGRVRFSDNGVGIPEAEWERVFTEFFRLQGRGPEVPGSGLGLALCQRIMRLHGGALRVAASSPEGTTFELTFPEKHA